MGAKLAGETTHASCLLSRDRADLLRHLLEVIDFGSLSLLERQLLRDAAEKAALPSRGGARSDKRARDLLDREAKALLSDGE